MLIGISFPSVRQCVPWTLKAHQVLHATAKRNLLISNPISSCCSYGYPKLAPARLMMIIITIRITNCPVSFITHRIRVSINKSERNKLSDESCEPLKKKKSYSNRFPQERKSRIVKAVLLLESKEKRGRVLCPRTRTNQELGMNVREQDKEKQKQKKKSNPIRISSEFRKNQIEKNVHKSQHAHVQF